MTEYTCFFFGPDDQPFGGERVYAHSETFHATSDDQARLKAHTISRQRDHQHGYEIWQMETLVHRHIARRAGGAGSQPQSLEKNLAASKADED